MYLKKTSLLLSGIFIFLFFFPYFSFSYNHPYIVEKKLLDLVSNEVSGERAWDLVAKISRYHRIRGGGTGSDYNRCVTWLARQIEDIGIADVKIKTYKADGFKKYSLWNSPVGWKVREAELWMVEPVKKLFARFSDQAISLMPYSGGGEVEAEVVFVEEGKSDEDYCDRDVKGKMVFALGGGGNQVHRQAVLTRGAVGVIVGPSFNEKRMRYPDLIELCRLSPKGEERGEMGFGFSLSYRQAQELLSLIKSGKKVSMKARVDAELFDGNMPVLEAMIIGKEKPSQEIIIVGHLDHYKPGANDNASGSAGMVEMIHSLAALIKKGEIPYPKRTLRFLWLPELHGTAAYLSDHPQLGERGIAGINLDMIGEDYGLCQSNFILTLSPYSVPGYMNDIFINLLGWLDSPSFFSPRGSRFRFNSRIQPYLGGSDHEMFNVSEFSIATPMLWHSDVFHHTNLDTPEKCDPSEMKRTIGLSLAATLFLANAAESEALTIAGEVYSQAHLRIVKRTNKSIQILNQVAADPEQRKRLAEIYTNISEYPKLQAQIEALNIRETKELCGNREVREMIDGFAENISLHAEQEKEKIDNHYKYVLSRLNLQHLGYHPDKQHIKASSLRPKKMFQGSLPFDFFKEKVGEKKAAWYEKNKGDVDSFFDTKLFEILNLMDGRRSLLEIRHIVSCEFDETEIELILDLVQDLVDIGLVSYKQSFPKIIPVPLN